MIDQPSRDGYWYLATPYTLWPKGRADAYRFACALAAQLINVGFLLYCPIAHSHSVATVGGVENTHATWLRQDRALLVSATGLIVADGPWLEKSVGMRYEIALAKELGKPVIYIKPVETLVDPEAPAVNMAPPQSAEVIELRQRREIQGMGWQLWEKAGGRFGYA